MIIQSIIKSIICYFVIMIVLASVKNNIDFPAFIVVFLLLGGMYLLAHFYKQEQ